MNLAAHLREVVTVWPVTGDDGYGGYTFGAPYLLRARWNDEQVKFITTEGEETVSRATVVLERPVDALDYIALGDFSCELSPLGVANALQVRGRSRTTNLRNTQQINQAFM